VLSLDGRPKPVDLRCAAAKPGDRRGERPGHRRAPVCVGVRAGAGPGVLLRLSPCLADGISLHAGSRAALQPRRAARGESRVVGMSTGTDRLFRISRLWPLLACAAALLVSGPALCDGAAPAPPVQVDEPGKPG